MQDKNRFLPEMKPFSSSSCFLQAFEEFPDSGTESDDEDEEEEEEEDISVPRTGMDREKN